MIAVARPAAKTTLFLTDTGSHNRDISALLRSFVKDRKMVGIYVTVNKSSDSLNQQFGPAISDKLLFIDMTEEKTEAKKTQNCISLHPTGLTDLGIALETAVKSIEAEKMFIVIDSISALFAYNPPLHRDKICAFRHKQDALLGC